MASKALLVFALLLAAAFLVATANEQSQANEEEEESKQVYGGYPGRRRGYPGAGGGRGYPYGGYPGGGGGGYPGGGYGGRGRHCRWGCCGRGYYYYGGCRCCFRPDEIPEPIYRQEVQN